MLGFYANEVDARHGAFACPGSQVSVKWGEKRGVRLEKSASDSGDFPHAYYNLKNGGNVPAYPRFNSRAPYLIVTRPIPKTHIAFYVH